MPRLGDGPPNAKIMLIGEAYGQEEERAQTPFVGASGMELNRMLQEAGIMRSSVYVTNCVNSRPRNNDISGWIYDKKRDVPSAFKPLHDKWVDPIFADGVSRLLNEIKLVSPNIIVCLGGTPLWALTGINGIMRWRGSMLTLDPQGIKLIPTIHPAAVLRQWELRAIAVTDFRRIKRESATKDYDRPQWKFRIRPTYNMAVETLQYLTTSVGRGDISWIDFDLETRPAIGHIDCAGISWSRSDAICIPFMQRNSQEAYWSLEEEAQIVFMLYKLLTHPKVKVRGQNLLYDCQYTHRRWHFVPRVVQDIMISQHTAFCAQKKSLDFQASIYCNYYVQWKKDKSLWKEE